MHVQYVVADARTTVRSGPDKAYGVLSYMEAGDRAPLLDTEGDWYRIEYKGLVGYVAKRRCGIISNEVSTCKDR